MRSFNLKGEWLVPHAHNDEHPHGRHAGVHGGTDAEPGRTIYPERLRMAPFDLAQDGWVQRNWSQSEFVARRECDIEDDQLRAAREWLAHVEAGIVVNNVLRVPCAYQGGKQRVAAQIVDLLLEAAPGPNPRFYDLCCGSAAVSIDLVNRGVEPSRIWMLDISSWGLFWSAIGLGTFNMNAFDQFLSELPSSKRDLKAHMSALSAIPVGDHEAELYPLLQACSFGGKQIWRNGERWANACFRDYWEPTATSVRRSPANPMQPSAIELRRRINTLLKGMRGVTCLHADITAILGDPCPKNSVVYVDPPYQDATG